MKKAFTKKSVSKKEVEKMIEKSGKKFKKWDIKQDKALIKKDR